MTDRSDGVGGLLRAKEKAVLAEHAAETGQVRDEVVVSFQWSVFSHQMMAVSKWAQGVSGVST